MKNFLLTSLFFVFCLNFYAQKTTITGKVSYSNSSPIEYATISLLAQDSVVQITQTDSLGLYCLEINSLFTNYAIRVTLWGVKLFDEELNISSSQTLIKDIEVDQSNAVNLSEITVSGKRNVFKVKDDKFIFTPDVSLLSSATAFDALKQVPLIKTTDNDISLAFKSGTLIYLNNRPLRMPLNTLIEYLKSTSADNIKNVEIITNPGSKYDASLTGGVINIVLHKNIDDGFLGQVAFNTIQSRKNSQTGSGSFRYRHKHLGIEGGISGFNYNSNDRSVMEIEEKQGLSQIIHTTDRSKIRGSSINLNIEYAFSEKHTVNFFSVAYINRPIQATNSYTDYATMNSGQSIDSTIHTYIKEKDTKIDNYFLNGSYQFLIDDKGQTLDISVDHMNNRYDQDRYTINTLIENNEILNEKNSSKIYVPQRIKTYSVKIDYTFPFNNNTLDLGVLYSHNATDNKFLWSDRDKELIYVLNENLSNNSLYKEDIGAFYMSLRRQWFDSLSSNIGFRGEYTKVKSKVKSEKEEEDLDDDYFKFFPSLSINYSPSTSWNVNYSLTGKIQRPAFWQLNPIREYLNESTYIAGNQNLRSSKILMQSLSITLKNKYSLNAEYNHRSDDIGRFLTPAPNDDDTNYLGMLNYGSRSTVYVYAMTSLNLFNGFWKSNISLGTQYDYYNIKLKELSDLYKNQRSLNGIFRIYNTFQLSEKGKFWGYLNFQYYTANVYLTQKNISYPKFGAELRKNWGNWGFSLIGNDIFKTGKVITKMSKNQTISPYIKNNYTAYYDSRSVLLRLSYRFGDSNAKGNRSSTTANDDVRGRVKN